MEQVCELSFLMILSTSVSSTSFNFRVATEHEETFSDATAGGTRGDYLPSANADMQNISSVPSPQINPHLRSRLYKRGSTSVVTTCTTTTACNTTTNATMT